MEPTKTPITIETTVLAPIEKVWACWTEPQHITGWNFASDDWHAPHAENDLRTSGKFNYTMAAKDGSMAFDFEGFYTVVDKYKKIEYEIADGRQVQVLFSTDGKGVKIIETFEAEDSNPVDMQRAGWQSILNNFKKYTEAQA